jgi:hypothetical protein
MYLATVLADTLNPNFASSALYSFLTPKLVFRGHSSDENLKLLGNCTTASPWPHPRSPRPIEAPATLMTLQYCLGLYDEEKIAPAAEPSACKYPKEPVSRFEVGSRLPALEHQ